MEDYLVLREHTVLAFLLILLSIATCSYLGTFWKIQAQHVIAERTRSMFREFANLRESGIPAKGISCCSLLRRRRIRNFSFATEWIAPLIAWVAVTTTTLAIIGLMFAEQ